MFFQRLPTFHIPKHQWNKWITFICYHWTFKESEEQVVRKKRDSAFICNASIPVQSAVNTRTTKIRWYDNKKLYFWRKCFPEFPKRRRKKLDFNHNRFIIIQTLFKKFWTKQHLLVLQGYFWISSQEMIEGKRLGRLLCRKVEMSAKMIIITSLIAVLSHVW